MERLAEIAQDIAAVRVFLLFGIDPLEAVPAEELRARKAFREIRWPQIVEAVASNRAGLKKLLDRRRK